MKYLPIDKSLFIHNRINFSQMLKPKSLAIFNSNDIMPTNADGTMPFKQNSDLFYLSGIDQEESVLLLFPDSPEEKHREILFLKETSELIAIWEGHKYTKEEAFETSGIKTVYWLSQFENILYSLASHASNIYLNKNEHLRASNEVQTRDDRFLTWCKNKHPLHQYYRSAPMMHQLRAIKSDVEISLIQKACDITEKGFRRILEFVKPGVMEYEIEAEFLHEFVRNRSKGFAYSPIIASGANACVLHYIENSEMCHANEVILFDVGAEYGNYNADMSRAIPVSGRFSPRQKDVYQSVRNVMKAAMEMLAPGNAIPEYHREVGKIMERELIALKLIDKTDVKNQNPESPLYKKYFMHGTSHHLGLDVHDVGDMYRKFEPGMVFTVEPGIYIQEENLGIRIENDVIITKNGINDLMKNIPIEAEEIEDLMNN